MGDSLLDKMYDAKSEYETAYYTFYGDGTVEERANFYKDSLESAKENKDLNALSNYLQVLARDHTIFGKYDSLDVNLSFGVVFKEEDVTDEKKPKGPAHAIKDIIDVKIDSSSSYLERELVKDNLDTYCYSRVGFMTLDNLISFVENEGLTYNGPENYEEVLYDYIYGKPMTATITANFSKKRNKTYTKA